MTRNYRLIIKVVFAIIGALAGICASVLFFHKYHNYNAGAWAAVSAVAALLFLYIVFALHRDVQRKTSAARFTVYMFIGGAGLLTGIAVFVSYLVIGATDREKAVDTEGSYVVVVWGFMTFKWSLFTLLTSRSYQKKYSLEGHTRIIST